jgi:hypothetical protein
MYNVFINDKSVNLFDTIKEAYDFAVAIEQGDTTEKFNPSSDIVTFEGEGCVETTKEYELDLEDNLMN